MITPTLKAQGMSQKRGKKFLREDQEVCYEIISSIYEKTAIISVIWLPKQNQTMIASGNITTQGKSVSSM